MHLPKVIWQSKPWPIPPAENRTDKTHLYVFIYQNIFCNKNDNSCRWKLGKSYKCMIISGKKRDFQSGTKVNTRHRSRCFQPAKIELIRKQWCHHVLGFFFYIISTMMSKICRNCSSPCRHSDLYFLD